jgi:enamine deaminase RidA (YjgF/YER057c/UK114 family)
LKCPGNEDVETIALVRASEYGEDGPSKGRAGLCMKPGQWSQTRLGTPATVEARRDSNLAWSAFAIGSTLYTAFSITPAVRGESSAEVFDTVHRLAGELARWHPPLQLVTQTVFVREAADREFCEAVFGAFPRHPQALTHVVLQPPADGARVAVEAWAVGGPQVRVQRESPWRVEVRQEGLRWIHVAGLYARLPGAPLMAQAQELFDRCGWQLREAGANWRSVVRMWWQVPDILGPNGSGRRYAELNRAREEAFRQILRPPVVDGAADGPAAPPPLSEFLYPASTGIGAEPGGTLALASVALTGLSGKGALLGLENPLQMPAYCYPPHLAAPPPMFSRAVALRLPEGLWIWISGTASIVGAEVEHPDDPTAQTEQTLDNIAALLSGENFARHGWPGVEAGLEDLVSARVYVKRPQDVPACRAVCERRLAKCPKLYLIADICRPALRVEIEGVAFVGPHRARAG